MDSGTIWGIVGTVIGVAGIVVALVFAKWRRFYFARHGSTIVVDYKNKLKELNVLYNGQEIENLSVTRLAFWNQGNDTISRNDISKIKPLQVKSENGIHILSVVPVYSSSDAGGINIVHREDGDDYLLDFEYLDPRKGGVLQIVHTGNAPSKVWLEGDIKGVKKVKRYKISSLVTGSHLEFLLFLTGFLAALIAFVFELIINVSSRGILIISSETQNTPDSSTFLAILVAILFVIGCAVLVIDINFIPKKINRQLMSLPLDNKDR